MDYKVANVRLVADRIQSGVVSGIFHLHDFNSVRVPVLFRWAMYVSFGQGSTYSVPIRWGLFISGPLR